MYKKSGLAAMLVIVMAAATSLSLVADEQQKQESGKVIRVLQDFESNANIRINPSVPIKVEQSDRTDLGKACLKITVPKDFDWTTRSRDGNQNMGVEKVCISTLSGPYLPPDSDAIRIKVKVKSGRAIITVGCPVSQVGNSDVLCDPKLVEAGKDDKWQDVEFSLNHPLMRNFRRPNFTRDLPVIYFTRWTQEPIYLYLLSLPDKLRPAEDTEIFLDQAEVLARGEGRPFPRFDSSSIKSISNIADFEQDRCLENVYSIAHGYSIVKPFEAGYRRKNDSDSKIPDYMKKSSHFVNEEGFLYPAPRYTVVQGKDAGSKALQVECVWAEEGQITAVKTQADGKANAFRLSIKPDYPAVSKGSPYSFDFEGKKSHAVDFLVFVSPKGTDFPWSDLEATDDLKKALKESGYSGPGAKYDYLLTTEKNTCVNAPDIGKAGSFGFYFTRRYMPAGEWSDIVLPFADFVCVYGQGDCKDMQLKQLVLSPNNISALGILAPFGTAHATICIDGISYVNVPGTPLELHSFWQVPDISKVKIEKLPRFSSYGTSAIMTLDGKIPDFLK